MGILNVTPDSFSEGGRFLTGEAAVAHGRELIAQGAEILDVGGESTRPGAEPVGAEEESARVQPVVAGLAGAGAQISIDTSKLAVAEVALREGASLVNDVTAFRARAGARGPGRASAAPTAASCTCSGSRARCSANRAMRTSSSEVKAFLAERLEFALAEGIAEERVLLDPGIGFGKTAQHNLELLRRLPELLELGRPLVIGTSRKGFLGRLAPGSPGPEGRLPGTIATNVMAFERGASVFRVHDVAPVRDALAVAAATLGGRWTQSSAETTAKSWTTTTPRTSRTTASRAPSR